MPVCFCHLLDRIADYIGHYHEVGTVVDQHRDKGMSEVVDPYRFDFCADAVF